MESLWVIISVATIAVGFFGALAVSDDGSPMWQFVVFGVTFVLGIALVIGGAVYYEDRPLECETFVETMVSVGDVEICMPTPDAVDLVEVYQS